MALPSDTDLNAAGLAVQVSGPTLTITLDKPERRNSQTPRMWHALADIGKALADDVRVVVVRGAGDCFSAGIDTRLLGPAGLDGEDSVAELMHATDAEITDAIDGYQRGFTWLSDPRPGHRPLVVHQKTSARPLFRATGPIPYCFQHVAKEGT